MILVGGPEAGRIRREHLVNQQKLTIEQAELELGIGDDDAPRAGIVPCEVIKFEAGGFGFRGDVFSNDFAGGFEGNVFVVTGFGFRRGREQGLREFRTDSSGPMAI